MAISSADFALSTTRRSSLISPAFVTDDHGQYHFLGGYRFRKCAIAPARYRVNVLISCVHVLSRQDHSSALRIHNQYPRQRSTRRDRARVQDSQAQHHRLAGARAQVLPARDQNFRLRVHLERRHGGEFGGSHLSKWPSRTVHRCPLPRTGPIPRLPRAART